MTEIITEQKRGVGIENEGTKKGEDPRGEDATRSAVIQEAKEEETIEKSRP